MLRLEILYYSEESNPVRLASLEDESLLRVVAQSAIGEAESAATDLASIDEKLGAMQLAEAARLRQVLSLVLPALADSGVPRHIV